MKFIDEATIDVIAGNGGNGCISFRREKYVPKGGPDGGDGGDGGNVMLRAEGGLTTLMDVSYHRCFKAKRGGHGKGKQMTGARGDDRVVRVPVGTIVYDANTGERLVDLDGAGIEWIAAKGGRGGRGNMRFVSSTRQAPRIAEEGGVGDKRRIRLELKLLADVGLIGLPNAGKSTLISSVSNARPKIADYPFTTKTPCLGLVRLDVDRSFVMADIPGLIEGAHAGAGMGLQFLRHIERTKMLLHLIDVTDPIHCDAVGGYRSIRKELESYSEKLVDKDEIIVLTKMDIPQARDYQEEIANALERISGNDVIAVSAASHEGLDTLLVEIGRYLFG